MLKVSRNPGYFNNLCCVFKYQWMVWSMSRNHDFCYFGLWLFFFVIWRQKNDRWIYRIEQINLKLLNIFYLCFQYSCDECKEKLTEKHDIKIRIKQQLPHPKLLKSWVLLTFCKLKARKTMGAYFFICCYW